MCQVEVGVHDQPQSQPESLVSRESPAPAQLTVHCLLSPRWSDSVIPGPGQSQQTDSLHAIPVAVKCHWPWPPEIPSQRSIDEFIWSPFKQDGQWRLVWEWIETMFQLQQPGSGAALGQNHALGEVLRHEDPREQQQQEGSPRKREIQRVCGILKSDIFKPSIFRYPYPSRKCRLSRKMTKPRCQGILGPGSWDSRRASPGSRTSTATWWPRYTARLTLSSTRTKVIRDYC